jgi:hypothetical protein
MRPAEMTLNEARTWIAGTEPPAQRASAQRLLEEALALPQRPLDQRDAAFDRIRSLDSAAPDYGLRSFGASMLETIGESVSDPVLRASMLDQALEHAVRYASGASSGGEGTARSRHVHEIEARLHLPAASVVPAVRFKAPDVDATADAPRVARVRTSRATALTLIVLGALGSVLGAVSLLFVLAGGQGSSGGDFFDALILLAVPPAMLVIGIRLWLRGR